MCYLRLKAACQGTLSCDSEEQALRVSTRGGGPPEQTKRQTKLEILPLRSVDLRLSLPFSLRLSHQPLLRHSLDPVLVELDLVGVHVMGRRPFFGTLVVV